MKQRGSVTRLKESALFLGFHAEYASSPMNTGAKRYHFNSNSKDILIADQAQQPSMTARTSASGALRSAALPGSVISTKRISPASDFLSTRMSAR